jgi:hypothetical protein
MVAEVNRVESDSLGLAKGSGARTRYDMVDAILGGYE